MTLDIYPIGGLGWNVVAETVFYVAGCDLLIRSIGFEECPSPQWVIGIMTNMMRRVI
jgi:hypothetical protein